VGALWLAAAVATAGVRAGAEERDGDEQEESEREGDPALRYKAQRDLQENPVSAAARLQQLKVARRERDRAGAASARSFDAALRAGPAVRGNDWINLGPDDADQAQDGAGDIDSGRVRSIVPHPGNPQILFVATAGGGVWKTYNGGTTWQPLTDRLGALGSGALAMDPKNPDILAYGLGDPFDAGLAASGITVTTDGGATWSDPKPQLITFGGATYAAQSVRDLKIDPLDSRHLLAATDWGLFTSADFGATWTHSTAIPENQRWTAWSIEFLGAAKCQSGSGLCSHWLMAGQKVDATHGEYDILLLRSSDSGATWTEAALPPGESAGAGRATIAAAPSTTTDPALTRVYVLAAASPKCCDPATRDLYRSDDGGRTFRGLGVNASGRPANPNNDQGDLDVMHFQSWYNQAIVVDPLDPEVVLLGGNLAMLRTRNGGKVWEVVTDWLPRSQSLSLPYIHADFHTMAAVAFPGGQAGGGPSKHFYFGSDGGLFVSDDVHAAAVGGAHVSSALNKGIVSHLVYSVACAADAWPEALQGFTLGGLQDNGTRLRALPALGASGGPSTFDVIRGGDGFDVAVSRNLGTGSVPVPSIVLATTYGGAPFSPIHASSDLGKTWIDLAGGLNTTALPFRMILATDDAPDSDGETFLTFSLPLGSPAHVYRLTKASAHGSWVALDGPVTYADGTVGQQFRDPPGNLITPHNLGTHQARAGVYAMTAAYGMVFTTVDAGAHWKASRPLGTCVAASCAAQQPNLIKGATQPEFDWSDATGNTLWVGSNTTALTDATGKLISGPVPDAYGHLFRTTDGGLTWLPVHGSGARQLPNTLVNTLKMDPRDPHTLYVGTVLGVYVTHDDGVTFDRMGGGLPLADVTQICVTPSTGSLKVSTYGRGFWQVDQHAAGIEAGAKGRGDLDYNQRLDAFDLLDLVAAMGATNASDTYRQEADLVGGTSAIDDADLGAFLARFGGTP
jgi:hypothetical protein